MKIKAPFKISYDGKEKLRVWGMGIAMPPFKRWGYNIPGQWFWFFPGWGVFQ